MTVLRPLNLPVSIAVETEAGGEPAAIIWRGRRLAVAAVADRWRIDDEWWRRPIARLYRCLVLADERLIVVFEDLLNGRWYAQRYGYSARYARHTVPIRRRIREPRPRYRRRAAPFGRRQAASWT